MAIDPKEISSIETPWFTMWTKSRSRGGRGLSDPAVSVQVVLVSTG